ncbi:GD18262 [Drosophila simulans]|uniref:GD18262 n=1 Tax=Drosophila simulans TaxID=7240 RepID=B4NVP0_DROSI|nr:GD18262 [Drosophila simulans]
MTLTQHDSDRDGLINTHELKELISDGYCRDIPAYIADQILKRSDQDNDGHLDFEEFYAMSLRPLLCECAQHADPLLWLSPLTGATEALGGR